MAECAHPLDVLGKILWLACFGGIIATGIIFIDPLYQESKYAEGACNVTIISYKVMSCILPGTGTSIGYLCVNFKGYYVKPTGYSSSMEKQWAIEHNYSSIISDEDTWKAKKLSSNWFYMAHKNSSKRGRDKCYVTFGDGEDYPCSTYSNMTLILNRTLTRDFPEYGFTLSYYHSSTVYPNRYKYLPIIYQRCYYSREYNSVILYKVAVTWKIVYFFLCWVGMFVAMGLLVKFGKGVEHEVATWVFSMLALALYVPFYVINFIIYIIIAIVAGFFCNYEMKTDMEKWINKGGIFRPLVKCWKSNKNCCTTTSETDNEPDVTMVAHSPAVVEIPQSAPDIMISNPSPTETPPSPRFVAFAHPAEIPQYEPPPSDIEWEAPPPTYDEVMK